jgi:hypothetical protein
MQACRFGTRLRTPDGDVPDEALQVGDLVMTLDHGPQAVRRIGARSVRGRGGLTGQINASYALARPGLKAFEARMFLDAAPLRRLSAERRKQTYSFAMAWPEGRFAGAAPLLPRPAGLA